MWTVGPRYIHSVLHNLPRVSGFFRLPVPTSILLQLLETPIMLASSGGHAEVVKALIELQADLKATDKVSQPMPILCFVLV